MKWRKKFNKAHDKFKFLKKVWSNNSYRKYKIESKIEVIERSWIYNQAIWYWVLIWMEKNTHGF
jgi:hypothetical protein